MFEGVGWLASPPCAQRAKACSPHAPARAPRCKSQKGEEDPQCEFYKKAYRSLCPNDWVRCSGHLASLAVTRCEGRAYLCRRVPVRKRLPESAWNVCKLAAHLGCLPRASAAQRTLAVLTVGSLCLQFASPPPPFGISVDVALPRNNTCSTGTLSLICSLLLPQVERWEEAREGGSWAGKY